MKKILKYLVITFIVGFGTMFCFSDNVKAVSQVHVFNGNSTSAPTYSRGDCDPVFARGNKLCRFRLIDSAPRGIRVSFVYYTGSSYTIMGKSEDIWASDPYASKGVRHMGLDNNTKVASGGSPLSLNSFFAPYLPTIMPGLQVNSSWLKSHFLHQDEMEFWAQRLTGMSLSEFTLPNEPADPSGKNPAKVGYRFLIEPIRGYTDGTNFYVMTLTEYARLMTSGLKLQQFYLNEEDILFTVFEDIGIQSVSSCNSTGGCTAREVADPRKGHALQIIDFSDMLEPDCDYETGRGYPVNKKQGDELTDKEKECCEEHVKEIQEKYKNAGQKPQQCMAVAKNVPAFVNCMRVYFDGTTAEKLLWEQEKKELLDFNEKYPACSDIGCEYEELIAIEEEYYECTENVIEVEGLGYWLRQILLCSGTECEQKYQADLYTYKTDKDGKHKYCDTIEWEKKSAIYECTPLPVTQCDEDNPNHFPSPNNPNPEPDCCELFEEQMKLEYEQMGYSQEVIKQKIEEWFYEGGKEFRLNCLDIFCNIDDPKLSEECCEDLMAKHPEKSEDFWKAKGCKTDTTEDECDWHVYADQLIESLKQMVKAECDLDSETKQEAHDTQNWDCIFDSDNLPTGTREYIFKDYFVKYSNPYCAVYCREDVQYEFPSGSMIVKAGNHFTVGTGGHDPAWEPIKFLSSRECKTYASTTDDKSVEINTEQFEEDWKEANDKVIDTWDQWKVAQQQDWSYGMSKQSPELDCDPECIKWRRECEEDDEGHEECDEVCVEEIYRGHTMYPPEVKYQYFGAKEESDVTPSTWCDSIGHDDPGTAAKALAHQKAKEEMETIETDIHACTQWSEFDEYRYVTLDSENVKAKRYGKYPSYDLFSSYDEFNPDVSIDYQEPTHPPYDYSDFLKKEVSNSVEDDNFSITGKRFSDKYDCPPTVAPGHRTCVKREIFDFSPQKEAHATYKKEVQYSLKDGVFNIILKPQGIAVNAKELGSSSSQVYIQLGYSALHVHFMTPSGRYKIGLDYEGFTPGEKIETGFEHNFDKLVDQKSEYDCTYQVHNEIIENDDPNCEGDNCFPCKNDNCDPASLKGLNLVYRPISLGNPFPGLKGEGRAPGSNWGDESIIERFITNNRGVNGSAVYQQVPMYQITLTPALIQKIRKYNETTTYNDFNLDCTSEGLECKSQFLRGTVGEYDFSKYFQDCKAEGNRGSAKCCGVDNWHHCDLLDGVERR